MSASWHNYHLMPGTPEWRALHRPGTLDEFLDIHRPIRPLIEEPKYDPRTDLEKLLEKYKIEKEYR